MPNSTHPTIDIDLPFDELIKAVKDELVDWGDKKKSIIPYGLGFYRIPLAGNRDEDGLALHFWLEGMPRNEDPHTHIFNLTSRVLCGQVEDTRWEATPSLNGKYLLRSHVFRDNRYVLDGEGTLCDIHSTTKQVVGRGQTYNVPKGVFHTSALSQFPTVTLIRREAVDTGIIVQDIVPRDLSGHISPASRPLNDGEYEWAWKKIQQIVARL
jgi:hypothetical protein